MTTKGARIGVRIRDRREARGLTLNGLSDLARVSKGYLSQLENGSASTTPMSSSTLR